MALYQGIIGGGSSPVEDLSPVLLWTNPNPSTAFAGQIVELDLSEYAGVLIEVTRNIDDAVIGTKAYFLKNDTELRSLGCDAYPVTTDGRPAVRRVTVTDTEVNIGNCIYAASGTIQNTACIPYKIYGVKSVLVDTNPILLWTNSNPSADFDAQTISLNLTNYTGVFVDVIGTGSDTVQNTSYFSKNDIDKVVGIFSATGAYTRTVNVNDDGITFGIAKNTNSATTNSRCIPLKIYGTKITLG